MEVSVERNLFEANDATANKLRELFAKKGLLVLNMISSPGAGKTSLLEKTLTACKPTTTPVGWKPRELKPYKLIPMAVAT